MSCRQRGESLTRIRARDRDRDCARPHSPLGSAPSFKPHPAPGRRADVTRRRQEPCAGEL